MRSPSPGSLLLATLSRHAGEGLIFAQKISNRPAAPMPPPTHIVTMPYLAPRRLPSIRTWPVMRAPDMP